MSERWFSQVLRLRDILEMLLMGTGSLARKGGLAALFSLTRRKDPYSDMTIKAEVDTILVLDRLPFQLTNRKRRTPPYSIGVCTGIRMPYPKPP
ncbi:hypothetical protein VNO77_46267 [Canavalia gladiata]